MKLWTRRILKSLAMAIAAIVLAGIAYEQVGRWQDRKRFPQIGRSVDIGGRTLNIYCSGEGSPTVVFDSGGHTAGYDWIAIQPQVAKFTRACWYDRAGYGWSDPGPRPRTFQAVMKELHTLLQAGGIPPPYVLVGTNLSGSHVRVYNGLYPREVAGAVLVDSSHPDAHSYEPRFMWGNLAFLPRSLRTIACTIVAPAVLRLGLYRLSWKLRGLRRLGATDFTRDQQEELYFLSGTPIAQTGQEGCDVDESEAQVRASGDFGNHPLIVLTSANPFPPPRPEDAKAAELFNEIWVHKLQVQLASLSTRGRQVMVAKGDFGIEHEAPEVLVQAIREVVTQVRSARYP
jgi:pimeloyl-ACP methyl ester carboxylesterase